MKSVLFPGTFDPPTLGHLDIIARAAALSAHVYIGVAENSGKVPLFTLSERIEMLRDITRHLSNVEVVAVTGLVADFAKEKGISAIVRGLRTSSDCEGEFRMALANRRMVGIETFFLVASEHLAHLTSTLIREIARSGRHLEAFVPQQLIPRIYAAAATKSIM